MPPTLLLIRHAQALHNVTHDWSFRDPRLTELGEQQSRELHASLQPTKIANEVQLIVVSAQRRTLQTATIGLDWLIKKGIPVLPHAGWQENSDKPCDTGSPLEDMQNEFPQYDFSSVDPSFPDKTTGGKSNPYAFTEKAIMARGQRCLAELYKRSEKVIAVVTHSGFLRTTICNRMFFNADWRVFEFDEEAIRMSREKGEGADGSGQFRLKEWEATEKKGGGMGRSEIGWFGIVDNDFPPQDEGEKAKEEEKAEELGEVTEQKPVA